MGILQQWIYCIFVSRQREYHLIGESYKTSFLIRKLPFAKILREIPEHTLVPNTISPFSFSLKPFFKN